MGKTTKNNVPSAPITTPTIDMPNLIKRISFLVFITANTPMMSPIKLLTPGIIVDV